MKQHWYLLHISGSHGLLECQVREGGVRAAYSLFYGLKRGFPTDHITVHELTKDLQTGKITTRLLKPPPPTATQ